MSYLQFIAYFIITLLTFILYRLHRHYNYFNECGIPHEKPVWLWGNMRKVGSSQHMKRTIQNLYSKYKCPNGQYQQYQHQQQQQQQQHQQSSPYCGFYLPLRKAIIPLDLDLIKRILITDFHVFCDRGNYFNEKDDPLSAHLFNLDGAPWKAMRAKLTPTFTSGKMKFMFSTLVEVGERFVDALHCMLQNRNGKNDEDIEIRELVARFTTDVIGCCAFGLECNSIKDPHTKFREMGKKVFSQYRNRFLFTLAQTFPNLCRALGITFVPKDVAKFFFNVVRETVEYRETNNIQRNDFMNLLIDLKKSEVRLTLEQIAAQAFVFFLAGFETSSSTISFALYELALNLDMQEKARTEIEKVLKKYSDNLTYEATKELIYLQQIFKETLRKYSIATIIVRKTISDYRVEGSPFVIEKGTTVLVPVDAIHHDPQIYPAPDEFRPERFTMEEEMKRHAMTWLPFGEGPRNCIGLRFGKMQSLAGLALLLKNFRFTLNKRTPVPLVFNPHTFILAPIDGIYLNIEKIT